MNCIDLAEIHAAAMGLDEASGPNVLQQSPPVKVPVKVPAVFPDLQDVLRENELRRKRIAAQRRQSWKPRKAVQP